MFVIKNYTRETASLVCFLSVSRHITERIDSVILQNIFDCVKKRVEFPLAASITVSVNVTDRVHRDVEMKVLRIFMDTIECGILLP